MIRPRAGAIATWGLPGALDRDEALETVELPLPRPHVPLPARL